MKARSLAVPAWISGYVSAPDVRDVAIKFSDGTTIHPEIVWVSEPINAGLLLLRHPRPLPDGGEPPGRR